MTFNMLNLSVAGVMIRFYLVMAVTILAGFTGIWLLALLALPIVISTMLGITVNRKGMKK